MVAAFKFLILLLFVFGFLEVSCRRQYPDGGSGKSFVKRDLVNQLSGDPENGDETTPTTTVTSSSTEATSATTNSTRKLAKKTSTTIAPAIKTSNNTVFKYRNKSKASPMIFSMFVSSGISASVHFILFMLLVTNQICVPKKKAPILMSPTPMAKK